MDENKFAKIILDYRKSGLSAKAVFKRMAKTYFFLSSLAAALIVYAFIIEAIEFTLLQFAVGVITGLAAGAILRDIGWFKNMRINWPFYEKFIDWNRVEEAAGKDDKLPDA